jgi:hypothetical protein
VNRVVAVAALAALLIGLPGCAVAPSGGEPSPSAELSAAPSESAAASSTPLANAEPTPDDAAFSCDTTLEGGEDGFAHLIDVAHGTHDGYDRVTFTYQEDSIPSYTVESAHAPFYRDPIGTPIDVAGASVFLITIVGGTRQADNGTSTYYGPVNFEPGYEQIVQLVESGDFEATSAWYLGLNGGECLRAFTLTDPTRIVIDVQH